MTEQQHRFALEQHIAAGTTCPQPVSLETVEFIVEALGEAIRGMRRRSAARDQAGATEYDSWLVGQTH